MRLEIYREMEYIVKMDLKPNYSAYAEQFNCDRRTVKKAHEAAKNPVIPTLNSLSGKKSKLDQFKTTIDSKVDLSCSATSIYYFIKKLGYAGKYSILRDYVRKLKDEKLKKGTIRVETTPGLQGQVDWKESMKLTSKNGETIEINFFLYVQCFTRLKYFILTFDRKQDTLFQCLIDVFKMIGGVPHEIWFDNMKTVMNHHNIVTNEVQFNERFLIFSKDMGFKPIACKPYRPQTKGKVEALAKCVDTLKVFNYEFESIHGLIQIVKEFNDHLNANVSQATNLIPNDLIVKEKEYLMPLPPQEIFEAYLSTPIVRKVSNESMVTYASNKYSVPTKFIGKSMELVVKNNMLYIYYTKNLICIHQIGSKKYNYLLEHYKEILKSDAFKYSSDEEIDEMANKNLKVFEEMF